MKLKLLITDKIDETQINSLEDLFTIDKKIGIDQASLKKIIPNYDCVITRSSTAITAGVIQNASKLKIIARAGIGVDNIDIFESTKRGIAVINAPKGNARATAEHAIGLIFSLLRWIPQASGDLKRGVWGKKQYVGLGVQGKTLGIVGCGNVGKEVLKLACGIGMKVVVCEPYVQLPEETSKVTFEELLRVSDVITFHVPLTYLTGGMLNANTIKLCKKGVYIINCCRGAVVVENAILQSLKEGHVAGFAVDVYKQEPPIQNDLLVHPRVISTPHIAGSTIESQRESVIEIVEGIRKYIRKELPTNVLNPQVFQKSKKQKRKITFDFDSVIFDCDSTLSKIEGIDELGKMVGVSNISDLTTLAMNGELSFETVYEKRLDRIKPSRHLLARLGQMYIDTLVEDAVGVIASLHQLKKNVFIVSGGFLPSLLVLGKALGIPPSHIFGNDLLFDNQGNYVSFVGGPLKRNDGKLQIIRQIPGRKLMVGDSITDLETKECVDQFVGFGGVIRREIVENYSDIYLYSESLAPILILAAGKSGCEKLLTTAYRKYVGKGLDLLSHKSHVKVKKTSSFEVLDYKAFAYLNSL